MNHLRLYRALVATYPKPFRQRFQPEMVLHFQDMSAQQGYREAWSQVIAEYPRTLISQHYQYITDHKGVIMSPSDFEKWLHKNLWNIFAIVGGYLAFLLVNRVLSFIQQDLGWERMDFGLTAWVMASLVAACLTTLIQRNNSRTNTLIVFALAQAIFVVELAQSSWQLIAPDLQYSTGNPITTLFFIGAFSASSLVVMLLANKGIMKLLDARPPARQSQTNSSAILVFWSVVIAVVFFRAMDLLLHLPFDSTSMLSVRQDLLLDARMYGSLLHPVSSLAGISLLMTISFIGIHLNPHKHRVQSAIGIALAVVLGYGLRLLDAIPTIKQVYRGAIYAPTIVPTIIPSWWWFVAQCLVIGITVLVAWLLHHCWQSISAKSAKH